MKAKFLSLFFICIVFVIATNQIYSKSCQSVDNLKQAEDIKKTENIIKEFYIAYCTWIDHSDNPNTEAALYKKYLTPQLIAKVKKTGVDHDYNLIINAQDFDIETINSLTVKHIDNDWYAVAYYALFEKKCVTIPVKIIHLNGTIMIDDIK